MTDDGSDEFQSADEMVGSVIKPDGEFRVAACSVGTEEKTKLIVQAAIVVAIFIIFLAIEIDPYFIFHISQMRPLGMS